ncbi:thymidine phosphorylase [Mycoplasmoides fastidiosum]|uniref:Thymidine phosphorylase n=1 Tax=Mycoplasmoides fastidiosum TaxID=92758 RepID=A0ABU0LYJ3_9BACT|nr:thymidine phosphorylase [Mycoplasmoides fastidiosum]MDQ0513781.1 thymidine phosphorylase [Mycoplasmoides fastidiosum]UUD37800.1 thymidine phosphorylase [Mycoplasmoides fastidiosum]
MKIKRKNKEIFNIVSFIEKKKNKQAHTEAEIEEFIQLVHQQKIADYQITAWLMAVTINGMNDDETYYLTKAILHSGKIYSLKSYSRKKIIDKHSTGGIGDKVSLILLPILVACGLNVAKLSGRSLGYTGGTIDKLNSLNVRTNIPLDNAAKRLSDIGMFVIEQSKEIAPVDKILYALRDVSGTVNSIPLIAASIMSKKLALKTDYLFLDVKYGSGSFSRTRKDAVALATALDKIAVRFKVNLFLHITSMQQPLGSSVGNLIELSEAYSFLNNESVAKDLALLIQEFAIDILVATKLAKDKIAAKKKYLDVLKTKAGLQVATEWFKSFGGDIKIWKANSFFKPKYQKKLYASTSGYFDVLSNDGIGYVANELGAGRKTKTDSIDVHAGLRFHKKLNDKISKGDLLITLYSSNPINNKVLTLLEEKIAIRKKPVNVLKLLENYARSK